MGDPVGIYPKKKQLEDNKEMSVSLNKELRQMGKKVYAVFCILDTLTVMGVDAKLPKGQYIMPIFEDYEEAVKYSANKHVIVEMSTPIEYK